MTTEIVEFNPFKLAWVNLKDRVSSLEINEFDDIENAKNILKECTELEKRIEDVRTSITKPVNDMIKNINNMAKEVALPVNEAKLDIKQKILNYNEEQERIKKLEENRIQNIIDWVLKIFNSDLLNFYFNKLDEIDKNNFIIKSSVENQKIKIEEKNRKEEEDNRKKQELELLEDEKKRMSEEQAKLADEKLKLEQEKRDLEEQRRADLEAKQIDDRNKIIDQIQNTEIDKIKWVRTITKWEIVDENQVPRSLCIPEAKKINELIKTWIKDIPWLRIREEKTIQ